MIITSNNQNNLSDAFLRRCLFHYIEFPKRQQLIEIIKSHFPASPAALVDGIIDRFLALREKMQKDKKDAGKKVSTSELMDWFRVLRHYSLFRKQVEHFCAKLELYSMQNQFSYGTLLSGP
ncbi:MAG: hypothetical protein GDA38_22910 [Hormoscilla sp. SP12CHS1]|nr:hypothetical protein [Hormoscilla sp. SP12CHS1]